MPISKKDLAKNISNKLGLSQKDSLFFVNSFFKSIVNNSKAALNISNFGSFSYKKTPKRIGRNPKTLQEFKIKPRQKLAFKPSDQVKQNIN